jgi:hypothetical protein
MIAWEWGLEGRGQTSPMAAGNCGMRHAAGGGDWTARRCQGPVWEKDQDGDAVGGHTAVLP